VGLVRSVSRYDESGPEVEKKVCWTGKDFLTNGCEKPGVKNRPGKQGDGTELET